MKHHFPSFIERLGKEAQEKVIKWNIERITHQEIADRLNAEYHSTITADNVFDFIKRKRNDSVRMIREDDKFQKELMSKYFDTIEQLNKINQEMWKVFYEIRQDNELKEKPVSCPHCHKSFKIYIKSYGDLIKTADGLLSQIRHVDAVLGKMSKKQLNVSVNILDLSKKLTLAMPQILDNLENRGIVKINKKRLKQVYAT